MRKIDEDKLFKWFPHVVGLCKVGRDRIEPLFCWKSKSSAVYYRLCEQYVISLLCNIYIKQDHPNLQLSLEGNVKNSDLPGFRVLG